MKRILIIAGGTGGHIFPALAIADHLKQQGVDVQWMGAATGMEKNLVGDRYPLYLLPVKGLRGKSVIEKLKTPFRLLKSLLLAYRTIQKIKPDVVLGMGGYASGPGGLAAKLLGIKLVIHEQNALPGLTNKLLSRIANITLQAFPHTFSETTKAVTVGNPVRLSIQQQVRADNYYQQREKPWKILILGGSQGARFINELIVKWVQTKPSHITIWHQTGRHEIEKIKAVYADFPEIIFQAAPFIENMDEAYAWADMIIARSGALTVYETATVGLPAVFIPYPLAVDDHQYRNALFIAKNKGAYVCRESEIGVEKLEEIVQTLSAAPEKLQEMSSNAKMCVERDAVTKIVSFLK